MNRSGHHNANFFIGDEVEHTPTHGQRTLFVVGYQKVEDIQVVLDEQNSWADPARHIKHIFFGANDSYHPLTSPDLVAWENIIHTFLMRGYWCSLDIPFQYVAEFNESSLCEQDRFVPIIKIPIPYIRLWNYNTCVKIDDKDFADTNPGVWVHRLHDLMHTDRFTDWSKYNNDKVTQ
jgi:hypothetical protein